MYREEGSLTSQWVGTGWVGFSGEGMVKRVGYGLCNSCVIVQRKSHKRPEFGRATVDEISLSSAYKSDYLDYFRILQISRPGYS